MNAGYFRELYDYHFDVNHKLWNESITGLTDEQSLCQGQIAPAPLPARLTSTQRYHTYLSNRYTRSATSSRMALIP